jgi:hypothetical protein
MMLHFIQPMHQATGHTECSMLEIESRFSYPGMLYVYPEKLDATRLRQTLAQVLDDFPEYASELVASTMRLRLLHGASPAKFETASLDRTVAELREQLRNGRCRELEPAVSTLKIARAREATLLIKLTEARDGCVLAMGWNHAVGDMHSTMLLLRAWADAYAGRIYHKPMRVTDRDVYLRSVIPNPSAGCSVARRASVFNAIATRLELLRPATQVLTEFSITELSALQHTLGGPKRVTQNDALCAHVYSVLRKLSGATQPSNLCLVVNYRKRLGLPNHIIGNMTSLLSVPVRSQETAGHTAAAIRGSLGEYANKHVSYHPTISELRACTRPLERLRLVNKQFDPGSGDILISNWNSFGTTSLSFGSARAVAFHPICLGSAQLPQWFMLVYELPRSQGVAVAIGLPKELARRWSSVEGQALLHGKARHEPAPAKAAQLECVPEL